MRLNAAFLYSLTAILSIVFIGCNKDENFDPLDTPIDTGKIIATSKIGTSGGTLGGGSLTVEIPAGAISNEKTLSISQYTERAFGANQTSDVWFVNNLPVSIGGKVTLRLDGVVPEEGFAAMLAEVVFVPSLNKREIVYHPVDYKTVEGGIEIEIPRPVIVKSGPVDVANMEFSAGVVAVAGTTTIINPENQLFEVSFPTGSDDQAQAVTGFLEEALFKYRNAPFNLSFEPGASWPLAVTVMPLKDATYGYFVPSMFGAGYSSIELNSKLIGNSAELRTTIGHEFMHYYQYVSDPLNILLRAIQGSPNLWVDEAVAVYCEEKFAGDGYISAVRAGNVMEPFAGGLNLAIKDPQNYGYGMAAMIKYIMKHLDPGVIGKTYEKIGIGESHGNAIQKALDREYKAWWPWFISYYAQGLLYKDVQSDKLFAFKTKGFKMEKISDTLSTDKLDLVQLQTAIYQISVDPVNINEMHRFEVKTAENASVVILKYNQDKIEQIGFGTEEASSGSIKEFVDDGFKTFFILVSNLDYGTGKDSKRSIETEIRLTTGNSLRISFSGWVETNSYENDKLVSSETVLNGYISPDIVLESNGNILSGSWTGLATGNSSSPNIHTGTVTVMINTDKSLNIQLYDQVVTSLGWKIKYTLNASSIPNTGKNRYSAEPSGFVTQFVRDVEFPNKDRIKSSGPPFKSVGGDSGSISVTFQ